ncbi:MAG: hypothetical protein OMM_09233 [Candidatus Magnetoglobus multicellularis str. Araruama]|uniref:ABC-three component systems C-terminal domain-containing protein n=1 Tax=Candidatus Magnetoglobus multicellularis str. Araruama TaxID=890399 RepID=A0A1V1P4T5_9BACT|nr:MAG: hypothetical protein OMM_09233 [Candidatus Magnetoglobus multicellularis str. Araruama]
MSNNNKAFQFMIENRKVIIETLKENISIPKAWDQLRKKMPVVEKVIKLNTFKANVKALNVVNDIMNVNQKLMEEISIIGQEEKYVEIRNQKPLLHADMIFAKLEEWAGGTAIKTPGEKAAILSVLAYFFDKCVIFEDAKDVK